MLAETFDIRFRFAVSRISSASAICVALAFALQLGCSGVALRIRGPINVGACVGVPRSIRIKIAISLIVRLRTWEEIAIRIRVLGAIRGFCWAASRIRISLAEIHIVHRSRVRVLIAIRVSIDSDRDVARMLIRMAFRIPISGLIPIGLRSRFGLRLGLLYLIPMEFRKGAGILWAIGVATELASFAWIWACLLGRIS